jgi:hypothetical protein
MGLIRIELKVLLAYWKDIGIFEDYPKDQNRWRISKLFKHSRGMKFSRGK